MAIEQKAKCTHLRSRNVFVPDFTNPDVDFEIDGAVQHYWCRHTMNTAGPDHALVVPEKCKLGRSCFEKEED